MKGERRDVKNFLPEFYSKEVASNASSALPRNCRRTILNTVKNFSPIVTRASLEKRC